MTNPEQVPWSLLTREEAVDPRRRIVDAHHHLYTDDGRRYLLADLLADTRASHNVTHTVFCETRANYHEDGPEELRPVGETEFVAGQARQSEASATRIAGIVGFADLRLGDALDHVLHAHEIAAGGRFRGIRHGMEWDASPDVVPGFKGPPPGLMADEHFRRGVARLGEQG